MCSKGTQTEGREEGTGEEEAIQEIRQNIAQAQTNEDLEEIMFKEWPEGIYKSTKITQGNPLKDTKVQDLMIVGTGEQDEEKGISKQLMKRFPEIYEGQNKYIICSTRVPGQRAKERIIYKTE